MYNQAIANALHAKGFGHFFNEYKLEAAERRLIDATAFFKSRLIDLMTFDAANRVQGSADYPKLPVLDREATIAAGKADYKRRMAEVRARFERPHPTQPPTASK